MPRKPNPRVVHHLRLLTPSQCLPSCLSPGCWHRCSAVDSRPGHPLLLPLMFPLPCPVLLHFALLHSNCSLCLDLSPGGRLRAFLHHLCCLLAKHDCPRDRFRSSPLIGLGRRPSLISGEQRNLPFPSRAPPHRPPPGNHLERYGTKAHQERQSTGRQS